MQACSPFVHCPTLLGRQTGGGLCQSPTDLKLPPCPLQPRVEVGTVAHVGDHSARSEFFWWSRQGINHFRDLPRFPVGYLTDFCAGAGLSFFNAAIWSRKWAARSNSRRDDASRISSSNSEITRSLS